MSSPGRCPTCNQPVTRRILRSYCDHCSKQLTEDKKTRTVEAVAYTVAALVIIVAGRVQTEKVLPQDPTASELFFLYMKILVLVTLTHHILIWLYMKYYGRYE